VDEINQGMDPRNERMVHGRMVDIACGNEDESGAGSQYFLITPKLLSGLKYRKGMRVLCIVSGEIMPKTEEGQPSKVDLGRWVAKAKELGLRNRTYGGERRANSGVHFSRSFDRSGVGDGDGRSQTAGVGA
jgi:structural maintenance of chromosomes protein 5